MPKKTFTPNIQVRHQKEFICEGCGAHVTQFGYMVYRDQGYVTEYCGECDWINHNFRDNVKAFLETYDLINGRPSNAKNWKRARY